MNRLPFWVLMVSVVIVLCFAPSAPVRADGDDAADNGLTSRDIGPRVPASAAQTHPLAVGARVPRGITLTTIDGRPFDLDAAVASTPTVLIFYRGGWCPFCTRQMAQLSALEPRLKGLGYTLLAIGPDSPASLQKSKSEHDLNYTLLSDSDMVAAKKFGLAWRVSDADFAYMKDHGVDIEAASGRKHHLLPVPAAYVVDKQGVIRFAFTNPDFKVRVDPDKLYSAATSAMVDTLGGH